ncbi:MAG: hypothetical protein AB7G39_08250 [Alphaproteobacteria bacterium]
MRNRPSLPMDRRAVLQIGAALAVTGPASASAPPRTREISILRTYTELVLDGSDPESEDLLHLRETLPVGTLLVPSIEIRGPSEEWDYRIRLHTSDGRYAGNLWVAVSEPIRRLMEAGLRVVGRIHPRRDANGGNLAVDMRLVYPNTA